MISRKQIQQLEKDYFLLEERKKFAFKAIEQFHEENGFDPRYLPFLKWIDTKTLEEYYLYQNKLEKVITFFNKFPDAFNKKLLSVDIFGFNIGLSEWNRNDSSYWKKAPKEYVRFTIEQCFQILKATSRGKRALSTLWRPDFPRRHNRGEHFAFYISLGQQQAIANEFVLLLQKQLKDFGFEGY